MALTIGIVGLPNVGKSTLFNALTRNTVLAANYPFATIEPNVGVVNLPDPRLDRLAEIRKAEGVADQPFEVHAISYDAYTPDGVKRLEERGVTDCIVGFRVPYVVGPDTEPLEKKVAHLESYAESVIAKAG